MKNYLVIWLEVWGFPGGIVVKNPPANSGDTKNKDLIPGLGRFPGVGNDNLFQYSCLKNSMDRGAGRLQSLGSQRVRHDRAYTYTYAFNSVVKLLGCYHGNKWCEMIYTPNSNYCRIILIIKKWNLISTKKLLKWSCRRFNIMGKHSIILFKY